MFVKQLKRKTIYRKEEVLNSLFKSIENKIRIKYICLEIPRIISLIELKIEDELLKKRNSI